VPALDAVLERGLLPDRVLRAGIRHQCARRLALERRRGESTATFAARLREMPVAVVPELANAQHYEVPPELFELCLGPRRKYSCCYWPDGVTTLTAAEEAMLALTCERAGIEDGMEILDLGCGWGSLTFWLLERYPGARVTAVSNSGSQRATIEREARTRGLAAPEVVTADMNTFAPDRTYDRVVSVEMFEHMRNYEELLRRVAGWLRPDGRLFVHVFAHDRFAYTFDGSWMARTFFSGGTMPSHDLFREFDRDLEVLESWRLDGMHYERTAEAWLANLDRHAGAARAVLAGLAGDTALGGRLLQTWRVFFMACAELFGYRGGREWIVSHHLFGPTDRGAQ
jgi:cyclopropane-fatty-acyl-phospholipid synthase